MLVSKKTKNISRFFDLKSNYKFITTKPGEINFDIFKNFTNKIYSTEELLYKQSESVSSDHLIACYILFNNEEVVGRFALYNNPHLYYKNKKAACIGSYECVDDNKISTVLLEHAKLEAQKIEAEFLIGPMDGSTWNNYRFSNNNNYPNFLLEPYHHIYYNQQFINNGFNSIAEYESTMANKFVVDKTKLNELENNLISKGLSFRKLDVNNIDLELNKLACFSNDAFKENLLYTPINTNVFVEKYKKVIQFINPEYVLLAEERNGNLVGVHFCYDSGNKHNKTLVVKTLARCKNKNYTGLGNYLIAKMIDKAFDDGYEKMIYAFMQKENSSAIRLSDELKAFEYKSYSLYGTQV